MIFYYLFKFFINEKFEAVQILMPSSGNLIPSKGMLLVLIKVSFIIFNLAIFLSNTRDFKKSSYSNNSSSPLRNEMNITVLCECV